MNKPPFVTVKGFFLLCLGELIFRGITLSKNCMLKCNWDRKRVFTRSFCRFMRKRPVALSICKQWY